MINKSSIIFSLMIFILGFVICYVLIHKQITSSIKPSVTPTPSAPIITPHPEPSYWIRVYEGTIDCTGCKNMQKERLTLVEDTNNPTMSIFSLTGLTPVSEDSDELEEFPLETGWWTVAQVAKNKYKEPTYILTGPDNKQRYLLLINDKFMRLDSNMQKIAGDPFELTLVHEDNRSTH